MTPVVRGMICIVASAVLFGFTPILTRIAFDGGANGISMTFLRATICLPVMAAILRYKGISLAITPRELRDIVFGCGAGCGVTTILLYSSYAFTGVGMATTLHFIYPVAVSLMAVFFFRERLTPITVTAIAGSFAGVVLFTDRIEADSLVGMGLALASGVTFAYYMLYLQHSSLQRMHFFKLAFYVNVMTAICAGIFGAAIGNLTFDLTAKAWLYAVIVSFCASMFAIALLQLGIQLTGALTASVLSTMEPITCFVLGALVLDEDVSLRKIIGSALILASVTALSVWKAKRAGA